MPHYTSTESSERPSIPLLELKVIDFALLLINDPVEVTRLLSACQTHGFFYLNLSNPSVSSILDRWEKCLGLMGEWFAKPLEEKLEASKGSDRHGYKPMGTNAGVTKESKDGWESLRLAKDNMISKRDLPVYVESNITHFESFSAQCQTVTMTILARLSDALGLQGESRLENEHRAGATSATNTMFLRYPKQNSKPSHMGQTKHTDIGTLTLLFCAQSGLQALDPYTEDWARVEPRKDHAIVNVGDSLRFLSAFRLKSALHRVVPLQTNEHRFSIAHFLRPDDEAVFVDSEGRMCTALEWHDMKHKTFKSDHQQQQKMSAILTGGMESTLSSGGLSDTL